MIKFTQHVKHISYKVQDNPHIPLILKELSYKTLYTYHILQILKALNYKTPSYRKTGRSAIKRVFIVKPAVWALRPPEVDLVSQRIEGLIESFIVCLQLSHNLSQHL